VPLLAALAGQGRPATRKSPLRAFTLGLITGAVYFGGTLYWTGSLMEVYGGLNWAVAILVGLLLVAYLALYPALFALITSRLLDAFGPTSLLLAPAVWVTTEFARARLLTGFPWVLLGYSQTPVLPIAQLASLLGVYGLSALVALVNAVLACLLFARSLRARAVTASLAIGCVVATSVWGTIRLRDNSLEGDGQSIRVGIVQGNVPQDQKWDQARANAIFEHYLDLTRKAAEQGAQLVLWPESSTPFMFQEDPAGHEAVVQLARETHIYILVGSDEIDHSRPATYYNAAFLVGPDGRTLATYRKIHLVPFGEYVPLKRLLFFVGPLVQQVGGFSAGHEAVLMPYGSHPFATAICYEIVYPELVRQFVLGGSQLITTITNDAWFGRSSAAYQHFEQASLRAIEEGRYLVRSANTGISGFVDPYGRVLARSRLFESAVIVREVRARTGLTVYARIGDVAAYLSMLLTAAALMAAVVSGRRSAAYVPAARFRGGS
jgi:apolipoprotein N-acyltransferase